MPLHEIFAGICSSFIISPIMSIIDISIIKSQLCKENIGKSISDNIIFYSKNKKKFIKPLSIMNIVYSSTYCTANLTEFYCRKNKYQNNGYHKTSKKISKKHNCYCGHSLNLNFLSAL